MLAPNDAQYTFFTPINNQDATREQPTLKSYASYFDIEYTKQQRCQVLFHTIYVLFFLQKCGLTYKSFQRQARNA